MHVNLVVPVLILSKEVNCHVLQSFLEEVLQLVLDWVFISCCCVQICSVRRERSQICEQQIQIFILGEDEVSEFISVDGDVLLALVSHSALNQALRLVQRETEADLVSLLVQIMGSYKTFAFRVILAKYLVEVGS